LVHHPNVVSIYEVGEEADVGNYYIAMEFLDGSNLLRLRKAHVAQKKRALPWQVCVHAIISTCEGLHFAHSLEAQGKPLQLVHLDLSPENIFVTVEGQVKVLDFGIAKAFALGGLTQDGLVKGKFSYMAPELLEGRALDRRTDVWSLGVTLYWLLAGVRPFRGPSEADIMRAILNEEPRPLGELCPDIPAELAAIVHRALMKDPDLRYSGADHLQRALKELMAAQSFRITRAQLGDLVRELRREGRIHVETPPAPMGSAPLTVTAAPSSVQKAGTWQRHLVAALVDLLPALVIWRFTYLSWWWAAPALLLAAGVTGAALGQGSLGLWLAGLRVERRGARAPFPRVLARHLLVHGWFVFLVVFGVSAYASVPAGSLFGALSGVLLLLSVVGAVGLFTKQRRTLFDFVLGVRVVRKR
jgi:uncharacterized RDD family membrane protein YckC